MARIEDEIVVRRPPAEVFDYLADGEALTEWMPDDFERVEKATDGPPAAGTSYRYKTKRGGAESVWEWREFDRPRRLAWRGAPVKPMGPFGAVEPMGEYTLDAEDGGTRVRAVMEPRMSGALKIAEPLLVRSRRRSWREQLERMKQIVESRASGA